MRRFLGLVLAWFLLGASAAAEEPAGAWRVEVLGPEGKPIPCAEAMFVETGPGYGRRILHIVENGKTTFAQKRQGSTVLVEIRVPADAEGRALPLGASLTGPYEPGDVVIRLSSERVLRGVVQTPAGDPVPGATVCAIVRRGDGKTGGRHAEVTTSASGSFRLGRLGPYAYRIEVEVPEGYVAPDPVDTEAGTRSVALEARRLREAMVVVHDRDGRAVPGCVVRIERPGAGDIVRETDAAGTVVLPPLDPGTPLPRWIDPPAGVALPRFEPHWFPQSETVTLERTLTLRGVVRDAGGNPVPDATVWLRSSPHAKTQLPADWSWLRIPGGYMQGAISDAEGRFVVTGLPETTVEVFAALAVEGRPVRRGVAKPTPTGAEEVTLVLPMR